MPALPLSQTLSSLFPQLEREPSDSTGKPESRIRQQTRAAAWRQQITRAYLYQLDRAKTDSARQELEAAYEQAAEGRPDFARIHRASEFIKEVPRTPFDPRVAQEIMKQARAIERGTYSNREKGQHGGVIGKSALRVLEVFLFVIWPYARKGIFPSLEHIAAKAQMSRRTVQTCLAVLRLLGFLTIHRRMKRVATALGVMCQQDTNAYMVHLAKGLGAIGAALFGNPSPEGKKFQAKENHYLLYGLIRSNQQYEDSGAGLVAPQVS